MESNILYAKKIMENMQSEAEAVSEYTELLGIMQELDLTEDMASIEEIISDELNHQSKLYAIYEKITGIEANKE